VGKISYLIVLVKIFLHQMDYIVSVMSVIEKGGRDTIQITKKVEKNIRKKTVISG